MRLDGLRQRPWLAAAVLGTVCGLGVGLAVPPSLPGSAVPGAEAPWSLPSPAAIQRQDEVALQTVRRAEIWHAGAGQKVTSKWRLVGVLAEGDSRVALLQVSGSKDLLRVTNGDRLPDDGQVVDVGRFGMRINIYGCENLILRLYTPGQRSPSPDCGYVDEKIPSAAPARARSNSSNRHSIRPNPGKSTASPRAKRAVRPAPTKTASPAARKPANR